jgi:hypothetical protein
MSALLSHADGKDEAVEKVCKERKRRETRGGGMRSTSVKIVLFI